jgi:CRISPR system Cascade subunit CasD
METPDTADPGGTSLLLFTLAAPLASFGDVAPGERRISASRPGRSMLIGLLAAALGLKRDDPRQAAFAASLAFAIRVDRLGSVMNDYHTTQTAPAKKNRRFATRRAELEAEDLGTILSQREYRMDSAFTIAVMALADGPFALEAIAGALRTPHFLLSAGRRACPLGLPPSPRILPASSLAEAFAAYDAAEADAGPGRQCLRKDMGMLPRKGIDGYDLAIEQSFASCRLIGTSNGRVEIRRDTPADRQRWQFSIRTEHVLRIALPQETAR